MKYCFMMILLFVSISAFSDYDRSDFGRWLDDDNDCQNLRQEILIEKSLSQVTYDETGCKVKSGLWKDDYTGIFYTRSSDVDIDHIVPLKHAFDSGADFWGKDKMSDFFNDPLNLSITRDRVNQSKGSKSIMDWAPEVNKCQYAARWVMVKVSYDLNFNDDEIMFLRNLTDEC